MDIVALLGIAIGLAADAFAVSVSNGSIAAKEHKKKKVLFLAGMFGVFQAIMPIFGWLLCRLGQRYANGFENILAFVLLAFIGGKMIYDAIKEMYSPKIENQSKNFLIMTLLLAFATSIDAFASGAALPAAVKANTFTFLLLSVLCIGVITFLLSYLGTVIGEKMGERFSYKAEILGGCILIILAFRVLIFK